MNLYALKFVRHDAIEDHFRLGWIMSFANAPTHHHVYGCELAWICGCPVPGGFAVQDNDPEAESLARAVADLNDEMAGVGT